MTACWPLLLLCCAALSASLPGGRVRRGSGFVLSGGLPLDVLFSTCETDETADIGPCVAELLIGAIDVARPSFSSGVQVGDDLVVLEPLDLDDIKPKKDKEFQLSATNLKIHGISNVQLEAFNFNPDALALDVSFEELSATGALGLKYVFITANPDVVINLDQLRVKITANWTVEPNPKDEERLDLVLSEARADFDLGNFSVKIDGLGGLGRFLERILNKNSEILVAFLVPPLEKSVSKKLNTKLNRIKLVS